MSHPYFLPLFSVDFVFVESWDPVCHLATSLEVVHLVAKTQDAANLVSPARGQELDEEDDVASVRNHYHGFLLADGVDDSSHCLLRRKNVHRECSLGAIEHSSVDEVRADTGRLDELVMAILLQLKSQRVVNCDGARFAGTVVGQARNT